MKKITILLLSIISIITSCVKNNCADLTTGAPASEVTAVETYLASKSITNATKDTRGFYFTIENAGNSNHPSICADVVVKYNGKLTNDFVFDSNTTGVSLPLKNLIIGWQEGIPLIGKGGKITLYIPPSLAYGTAGRPSGNIPGNAILIFTIELISFS